MRGVLVLTVGFSLFAGSAWATSFTCPASVADDEASGIEHNFRHVSFFDGDPNEMVDLAPAEGPDPQILEQSWMLARSPRRPVVMVCRYHGTDKTVRDEVPEGIKGCTLKGFISAEGEVIGSPSLTCE